jgi:hypothetical protein
MKGLVRWGRLHRIRGEWVQQKIFVKYYSVRAGVGYCGRRRRFVDTHGIDQ